MPLLSSTLQPALATWQVVPPSTTGGDTTVVVAAGVASLAWAVTAPTILRSQAAPAAALALEVTPPTATRGVIAPVASLGLTVVPPATSRAAAAGVPQLDWVVTAPTITLSQAAPTATLALQAVAPQTELLFLAGAASLAWEVTSPAILRTAAADVAGLTFEVTPPTEYVSIFAEAAELAFVVEPPGIERGPLAVEQCHWQLVVTAPTPSLVGIAARAAGAAPLTLEVAAPAVALRVEAPAIDLALEVVAPTAEALGEVEQVAGVAALGWEVEPPGVVQIATAGVVDATLEVTPPDVTQVVAAGVVEPALVVAAPAAAWSGTAERAAGVAPLAWEVTPPGAAFVQMAPAAALALEVVPPTTLQVDSSLDHPLGGRGIGPEAEGTLYPLAEPEELLEGVLAEVYLALSPAADQHPRPFRVAALYGFDKALDPEANMPAEATSAIGYDVVIADRDNQVVFDSRDADRSRATLHYAQRLHWYEWADEDRGLLRVIQHAAWPDADHRPEIPAVLEVPHPRGRLDERCIFRHLPFVRELRIPDLFDPTHAAPTPSYQIDFGYNATLRDEVRVEDLQRTTRLTLDFSPGAGRGRTPGCTEEVSEEALWELGGATADPHGELALDAAGCLWMRPVITVSETSEGTAYELMEGTVRLGDDCNPCLSCTDVVGLQEQILQLWARARQLSARLEALRDGMSEFSETWGEQKSCREAVAVTIDALAHGRLVELALTVCNHDAVCQNDVELRVELETPSPDLVSGVVFDTVTQSALGQPEVPYLPAVATPILTGGIAYLFYFDTLQAQGHGVVKLRVALEALSPGPRSLKVVAQAGLSSQGQPTLPAVKVVPVPTS